VTLTRIAWLSVIIATGISVIAIVGWASNWLIVAQISPQFIPMPPSTALMFLLLCASWFAYYDKPSSPPRRMLAEACALIVLVFCLIVLIEFLTGIPLDIEQLFLRTASRFGSVPIGGMSPITAAGLVLAGASLVISSSASGDRRRQLAAILALLAASIGFVIILGYLFGAPLLYGSSIIPVALTTAIALDLLGMGVCASAGPTCWPIRIVIGPSLNAQLLRGFLPLTIAIVLFLGWFYVVGVSWIGNPALTASLALFLALITVITIASRTARRVGEEIDQTHDALRESEEKFRRIAGNTIDNIFELDLDGTIRYDSPASERIFGYKPEEVTGRSAEFLFSDSELPKLYDSLAVIANGKNVERLETEMLRKDGSQILVEINASPILREERIVGALGFLRDITERRRAESALRESEVRYRTLFDSTNDAIFIHDMGRKFLEVNRVLCELTGHSREELLQMMPTDINSPEYARLLPDRITQLRRVGHAFFEAAFVRRDGTVAPIELSSRIIEYKGKPAVLAVARDITERKQMERMKDQFVSTVSHELRTPLTSIRASLGLLASGVSGTLPEKGQRMLEIAVTNTDRLVRLINDILDSERLASGKTPMEKKTCNAGQLVTQAADVMKPLTEKAGISLSVESQDAALWADPDRIAQALTNLVGNAIKFSPKGGRIWVTAERKENQMVFKVRDEGRGIPPDKLGLLFERFQQVDASDAREKGGTGLGLSISRSIVEQHNGRIWVESTVGKGSTFFFTVPLLPEAQAPLQPEATTGAPSTRKVLIIEDDPDLANILAAMLERHNIQSHIVLTGGKGIALSKQMHPDLIVLDLILPDMDGSIVVEDLRKDNILRSVPLVVYTVRELDEQQRENLRLGETLFFTKSRIPPEQFEEKVVQFMERIFEDGGSTGVN